MTTAEPERDRDPDRVRVAELGACVLVADQFRQRTVDADDEHKDDQRGLREALGVLEERRLVVLLVVVLVGLDPGLGSRVRQQLFELIPLVSIGRIRAPHPGSSSQARPSIRREARSGRVGDLLEAAQDAVHGLDRGLGQRLAARGPPRPARRPRSGRSRSARRGRRARRRASPRSPSRSRPGSGPPRRRWIAAISEVAK